MTIADALERALDAARADLTCGCDAAAAASAGYIRRRLQQLERRFPNHHFVFVHDPHISGLQVTPGVRGYNCVDTLLKVSLRRSTCWPSLRGLKRVQIDLDDVAWHAAEEFSRYLGRIEPHLEPGGWWSAPFRQDEASAYRRHLARRAADANGPINRARRRPASGGHRASAQSTSTS